MSQRTGRALVLGSYGHGNLGDDLLLQCMLRAIRHDSPDYDVTALSLGAADEPTGGDVELVGIRLKRPKQTLKILLGKVLPADVLFIGAGGLVNDLFPGVLPLLTTLAWACRLRGMRVGLIGVGVGPLSTRSGKRWARTLASAANVITVRDEHSPNLLKATGRAKVGTDFAWSLVPPDNTQAPRRGMLVSLRPWRSWPAGAALAHAERAVLEFSAEFPDEPITLLAMDRLQDPDILRELAAHLPAACQVTMSDGPALNEVAPWFSSFRRVLAMRFHAGLLGAAAGCEVGLMAYDPKVLALAQYVHLPHWVPSDTASTAPVSFKTAPVDTLERARTNAGVHTDAIASLLRAEPHRFMEKR